MSFYAACNVIKREGTKDDVPQLGGVHMYSNPGDGSDGFCVLLLLFQPPHDSPSSASQAGGFTFSVNHSSLFVVRGCLPRFVPDGNRW